MKKNTISILFLSFLVSSFLISCSGSTQTNENTADSTAIETTTQTPTNPAFEQLLSEFENCEEVELFLKGESCGLLKETQGKDKMASLATQIFTITGKGVGLKFFGTEDFLEGALTYPESTATLSIHSLFKATWEDLVFISFTVVEADGPQENQSSTILIFNKSGEFKEAFTSYTLSSNAQVSNRTYISKVEKTEQSVKLIVNELEQKQGKNATITGAFYLIDKDGTVTYDDSQKK